MEGGIEKILIIIHTENILSQYTNIRLLNMVLPFSKNNVNLQKVQKVDSHHSKSTGTQYVNGKSFYNLELFLVLSFLSQLLIIPLWDQGVVDCISHLN